MSEPDHYFKARIPPSLEDAIRHLSIELRIGRSEAGRELMRRGSHTHTAPVIVRPQWSDDDLGALDRLRQPAHENYKAAKELRSLADEFCGDATELRKKIATAGNSVYGQYIAIRNIRDSLTGLKPEQVEIIKHGLKDLDASAADGCEISVVMAMLLRHLGF